jgi:hypothetical protein
VVLLGKLAELLVAVQQEILHFLRFCCAHTPPSLSRRLVYVVAEQKLPHQGSMLNPECPTPNR